jgi:hypothetical protein
MKMILAEGENPHDHTRTTTNLPVSKAGVPEQTPLHRDGGCEASQQAWQPVRRIRLPK